MPPSTPALFFSLYHLACYLLCHLGAEGFAPFPTADVPVELLNALAIDWLEAATFDGKEFPDCKNLTTFATDACVKARSRLLAGLLLFYGIIKGGRLLSYRLRCRHTACCWYRH